MEEKVQSLASRPGFQQILAEAPEDHFIAQQLARLVIHHQYVCLVVIAHLLHFPTRKEESCGMRDLSGAARLHFYL